MWKVVSPSYDVKATLITSTNCINGILGQGKQSSLAGNIFTQQGTIMELLNITQK